SMGKFKNQTRSGIAYMCNEGFGIVLETEGMAADHQYKLQHGRCAWCLSPITHHSSHAVEVDKTSDYPRGLLFICKECKLDDNTPATLVRRIESMKFEKKKDLKHIDQSQPIEIFCDASEKSGNSGIYGIAAIIKNGDVIII